MKTNPYLRTGYVIDASATQSFLFRKPVKWIPQDTDEVHLVTPDDRLDTIAYQYYQSRVANASQFGWLIADANDIYNPFDLSEYVGKEILIPDVLRLDFVVDKMQL